MKNYNVGVGGGIETSLASASKSRPAVSPQPKFSKHASLALSAMLAGAMLCGSAQAQEFPEVVDLGNLDGSEGFLLNGEALGDLSGRSVRAAGDVNGDGIGDLIIGASQANPIGAVNAGRSYVVFGIEDDFPADFDLESLNGTNGFILDGEFRSDESGVSVSGAGDFNGDEIDDVIIGAWKADPNGASSGRSYIVFGGRDQFDPLVKLADLDGSKGFKLDGVAAGDLAGYSVAGAGDINNDGFDDVIIGAPEAGPNGTFWGGQSYVVFGTDLEIQLPLQLSGLNGSNGFKLSGADSTDRSGISVGNAGDFNGDGIDDLIIGADGGRGRSYIVFGKQGRFAQELRLGNLDGSDGFKINGESAGDSSGYSVGGVGDVNDDDLDDVVIGAWAADYNGSDSGSSYVVFGRSDRLSSGLELSDLNGSNGFRVDGESFDESGSSASGTGDVNGDGIDDVIIGAPNPRLSMGSAYVVFGRSSGNPAILQLASLDGTNGFKLNGENDGDVAGISVSGAGDINGDGRPDLIIGASGNDANGQTESGRSYVIYGRGTPTADDGVREEPILFVDSFEPAN